jgi:MFS transporter, FSR family, fosmidomycin resistance protein
MHALTRRLRSMSAVILIFLLIEFLDEFFFGVSEAAWPLIRNELHLSYAQIGLLMGLPALISFIVDIPLGIYADLGYRRRLVIAGGIGFIVATVMTALAPNFAVLMLSFILFFPSSSAFVSLSQASLMDLDPTRHEQNMARWTFAGSAGVVVGALAVSTLPLFDGSWRSLFILVACLSLVALWGTMRLPTHAHKRDDAEETEDLRTALRSIGEALRNKEVLRWVVLLMFSDLMLDKLLSYMALYFVDVGGVSEAQAGIAVAAFVGLGLLGDLLAIPLLERVSGMTYLRVSAALMLVVFPMFLLVEGFMPKLICAGLIGLLNSGWYSVLQGQLYSAMPGRSGAVTTVGSMISVIENAFPLAIGLLAQGFGLGAAMWLLWLGPIAILFGLPRRERIYPKFIPNITQPIRSDLPAPPYSDHESS